MDDDISSDIGSHSKQGYFRVQVVPSGDLDVVDPILKSLRKGAKGPVRSLITGLLDNPIFFLLIEFTAAKSETMPCTMVGTISTSFQTSVSGLSCLLRWLLAPR